MAGTCQQGRAEVLRIEGINTEERAESGVAARSQAFAAARRTAISRAFGRLGVAPRPLNAEERELAIAFLEPRDEIVAPHFYRATFTVGVDTNVLFGRMPGLTIEPDREADMPDWVLVVPIHRHDDGIAVWQSEDGWTRMWLKPAVGAATTFMTSVPDDEDAKTLTPVRLARDGAGVLATLARKYGAPAVVLAALARTSTESGVSHGRLQAVFWSPRTGRRDFEYLIKAEANRDVILQQAAAALHAGVRKAWAEGRREGKTIVTARMRIASSAQWRDHVARMERISGLEVETKRLRSGEAEVELLFAGSRDQLIEVLTRQGFIRNQHSERGEH
jgi:hypothetical protein